VPGNLVEAAQVEVVRTPNEGIQPQAAVDAKGVLHLMYYKGAAGGGDLFYARQQPGETAFSTPIPVNSRPGSAIAAGNIRGAQLALGRDGRVHVAWMGGSGAERVMIRGKAKTPMLYTRLNDSGTAFEPERNLLSYAAELDGGGTVAADDRGNVYVAWHSFPPGNTNGEAGRAVFVARSHDDGKTFAAEKLANPIPTGACACCGMRAFADSKGNLYMMYRAATGGSERGMELLTARAGAGVFQSTPLSEWKRNTCMMSSAYLAEGAGSVLAAWEGDNQVQFCVLDPLSLQPSRSIAPVRAGKPKYPTVARNSAGETLFAWTEGTGWAKGGSLAWQVYDSKLKPVGEKFTREGVPAWSLVAAVAKPDGNFLVFY
jgi:hypothetical protein